MLAQTDDRVISRSVKSVGNKKHCTSRTLRNMTAEDLQEHARMEIQLDPSLTSVLDGGDWAKNPGTIWPGGWEGSRAFLHAWGDSSGTTELKTGWASELFFTRGETVPVPTELKTGWDPELSFTRGETVPVPLNWRLGETQSFSSRVGRQFRYHWTEDWVRPRAFLHAWGDSPGTTELKTGWDPEPFWRINVFMLGIEQ